MTQTRLKPKINIQLALLLRNQIAAIRASNHLDQARVAKGQSHQKDQTVQNHLSQAVQANQAEAPTQISHGTVQEIAV